MQDIRDLKIVEERETGTGWMYRFGAEHDGEIKLVFTMSWHDYEDIAGGGVPPSELAAAAVRVLNRDALSEIPGDRVGRIDLSTARRLVPDFTELVRGHLTR